MKSMECLDVHYLKKRWFFFLEYLLLFFLNFNSDFAKIVKLKKYHKKKSMASPYIFHFWWYTIMYFWAKTAEMTWYFPFFWCHIIGYFWAKKAEMQRNQGSGLWDCWKNCGKKAKNWRYSMHNLSKFVFFEKTNVTAILLPTIRNLIFLQKMPILWLSQIKVKISGEKWLWNRFSIMPTIAL